LICGGKVLVLTIWLQNFYTTTKGLVTPTALCFLLFSCLLTECILLSVKHSQILRFKGASHETEYPVFFVSIERTQEARAREVINEISSSAAFLHSNFPGLSMPPKKLDAAYECR